MKVKEMMRNRYTWIWKYDFHMESEVEVKGQRILPEYRNIK